MKTDGMYRGEKAIAAQNPDHKAKASTELSIDELLAIATPMAKPARPKAHRFADFCDAFNKAQERKRGR